jgi:DNA modification methylase
MSNRTTDDSQARQSESAPAGDFTLRQGDARHTDKLLSDISSRHFQNEPFLMATITSPPYANLVDYGSKDEIGFGQSYEDYLEECKLVFAAALRWTVGEGSMWLIADTVAQRSSKGVVSPLRPLPFDLARVAAEAGWILRDIVIWRKDRTRPWTSRGRLRNAFEYVLLFVKSNEYKYRVGRLRDNRNLGRWWVRYPERHNPWGAAPENVWDIPIPVQGSWATTTLRHACPFPPELVRRLVELSTDPQDIVFDPFAGSGTVLAVADALGRVALGSELNQEFVRAYADFVYAEVRSQLEPSAIEARSVSMTENLLDLRYLKLPKELVRQLGHDRDGRNGLRCAVVEVVYRADDSELAQYGAIRCTLITPQSAIEDVLTRATVHLGHGPLSKYGVKVQLHVIDEAQAIQEFGETEFFVYERGRTWNSSKISSVAEILAVTDDGEPPVLGKAHLQLNSD